MSGSERIARFQDRHIGPSEHALTTMLMSLGFKDLDSFAEVVVPDSIRTLDALENHLPEAIGEHQVLNELKTLASRNKNFTSLIGNGYFGTLTPPVIVRNLLENPAWYTAYTPYQPEISQGRLEALFAFQTMITDLTGLSISNASMLDEPTAAAEAMTLARRSWQGDDDAPIMVEAGVNPQTIAVLETRARPLGIKVVQFSLENPTPDLKPFAVLVQSPDTHGVIHDLESIRRYTEKFGSSLIVATDLLALTLMKSPGEYKADIAVGSAQRFGVPMGFGGPHAGFLAVRDGLERSLPGRLVGMSVDSHGNPALRLALQTREQHIRRDRATSNICTAQVLLANIAAMYAAYHGPSGLRAIAKKVHDLATTLRESLIGGGYKVRSGNFFDTISVVTSSQKSHAILDRAREMNYNLRKTDSGLNVSF
ncbi:MAG: glycine dehydrogenase, partial [Candidatus Nanopelagicaceae bacterium]